MQSRSTPEFVADLLRWQQAHGRHDLPWQQGRSEPDYVYRVWLSEIMLQQTQVATVIPYFNRFVARFPDLRALAAATEQEVLALWAGLGYYQRGRNLLACAQAIHIHFGGQFPQSAQTLQSLPGIGRSTAAAIAATVFQERVAILDGNVKRVLARMTCADAPWQSPALERLLWKEAESRLPTVSADMPAYTQALMDLGATVCRAKNPACDQCPVIGQCSAFQENRVAEYPKPRVKRSLPTRKAYWVVIRGPSGVWLMQQPTSGIWPGLWCPWQIQLEAMPSGWQQAMKYFDRAISIRHSFTHYRLEISAGIFNWPGTQRKAGSFMLPAGLAHFPWAGALRLPLPAPVKSLLLTLCPSGKASGDARRRSTFS